MPSPTRRTVRLSHMKVPHLKVLSSPHVLYAIIAVFFTTAFIVLTPPMSTPDAPQHYTRAYAISIGKFTPSEQGPGTFTNSVTNDSTYNLTVGFQSTSDGYYLPRSVVEYTHGNQYAGSALAQDADHPGEAFVYENQTEGTSPIAYLPQVLALLVTKPFTKSPELLAYAQEIALALLWILGITLTIRIAPFGKWAILFIALLPTQIQDSFQLGADVMTTLPAVLAVALLINRVVHPLYQEPKLTYEFALLSLLITLSTQGKVVMLPLLLILLAYPLGFTYSVYQKGAFLKTLWKRCLGCVLPIAGILTWGWISQINGRGLRDVYIVAPSRMQLLLDNPIHAITDWVISSARWLMKQFDYSGLISSLHAGDTRLPGTVTLAGFCILVILIFCSEQTCHDSISENTGFTQGVAKSSIITVNIVLCLTALGITMATLLSMYVIWTPIGAYGLLGVQSRYLLPCLYIVAMLFPPKPLHASITLLRWLSIGTTIALGAYSLIVLG